MSQPRFRVQSRYVLLTYAQCGNLDEWRVHDVITSFPAEVSHCTKTHADGEFISMLSSISADASTSETRDALMLMATTEYIQPCGRTPQKMLDYAIKDGDIVAGGSVPSSTIRFRQLTMSGLESHMHLLWTRFWDLVRELAPRTLCCNFNSCVHMPNGTIDPGCWYQHPVRST